MRTDIREIVLLATYPDGIPTSDYSKVCKIIESITMATLAGLPVQTAARPVAPKADVRRWPKTRLNRTDGLTVTEAIAEAVKSGPKTTEELVSLTGATMHTVVRKANAVARRDNGRWVPKGRAQKTESKKDELKAVG
jgi:hypothetical protein